MIVRTFRNGELLEIVLALRLPHSGDANYSKVQFVDREKVERWGRNPKSRLKLSCAL